MENIHDWCISRQLWWGHRIPVWYCLDCQQIIVSKVMPEKCSQCSSTRLKQDEDVLDTWFSSWLWSFSTFGWPEKTEELKSFYPTCALFTASEIIFLWVARMVMAGFEFMGDIPFSDVYIHGTVRDAKGIKMSKSLGNGIDPLDIIKEYGADALRVSMILVTPEGQDPCISFNTFEIGRNFANKLWNASRLMMMNLKSFKPPLTGFELKNGLQLADRWILSKLNRTIGEVTNLMSGYRFNTAAKLLYDFVWHDFCDWYLEIVKPRLNLPEDQKTNLDAKIVTSLVLDTVLRLLHPFMPYVTEEIWHGLYDLKPEDLTKTLMKESWPKANPNLIDQKLEEKMESVQNVVYAIRNIRSEMNIAPSKKALVVIKGDREEALKDIEKNKDYVLNLGKVNKLEMGTGVKKPINSASAVIKDMEIFVPLEGLIDPEKEKNRLQKEMERYALLLDKANKKLSNDDFLKRAPKEIINKEKEKKQDYEKMIAKLEKNLEAIMGW
jgi:valyl-tRNA synthetase